MTCPTCNLTVAPVKLGRLTLRPQRGEVLRRFANGEATDEEFTAAGDAAGDAEREWQFNRLMGYLFNGETK